MRHGGSLVRVHHIGLLDEHVARGGLHESHVELGADLAQVNDVLLLEVVVFKDDFEHGAIMNDNVVDLVDLRPNVVPVASYTLTSVVLLPWGNR